MERRRHQRAPLVREAVAYFGNTGAPCRTLDVSSGGIALALPAAQPAGQFVRISWAFESGLWVDADAVIVRVDRRYAEWVHGTSFLNIEAVIARQIDEYVKHYDPAATPGASGAWRRVGSVSDLPAAREPTRGTTPIVRGATPIVRGATPIVRGATPIVSPIPAESRAETAQVRGTPPPAQRTMPPGRGTTPAVRFTPPPSRIMPTPSNTTPPPARGTTPQVRGMTPQVRGMTPQAFRSPSSPAVPSRSMTPSRPPAEGAPLRPSARPSSQSLPRGRTPAQAGDFAGTLIPRNKDELRQLYEDALREVDGVTRKPDKR